MRAWPKRCGNCNYMKANTAGERACVGYSQVNYKNKNMKNKRKELWDDCGESDEEVRIRRRRKETAKSKKEDEREWRVV